MKLKKLLSQYYYAHIHDSPWGCRARLLFSKTPVAELRPFSPRAAISDLFVWRVDDVWDTSFDIFNISSFVYPDDAPQERCHLIFFDGQGKKIAVADITLAPFERKTLQIADYIGAARGLGTFAVFHHTPCDVRFAAHKTHLTERGYIAYHRKGDHLKSYCHGNLQALSQAPGQDGYSYVAATAAPSRYHPQLILSDSPLIELIYTNPSPRAQDLIVHLFDRAGDKIGTRTENVPARSVRLLRIDNADGAIHTFDNVGRVIMWRPVIKKHYATHFDVMHG